MKSLKNRKKERFEEMYNILLEFQHVVYVKGGYPDDIMNVAAKALKLIREITNPVIIN